MNWKKLDSIGELDKLIHESNDSPLLLFKHSTRCSISSLALNRLKSSALAIECFILNVIENRDLSNLVAQQFNTAHQSPQVLIIHKRKCIFHTSHFNISPSIVEKEINLLNEV